MTERTAGSKSTSVMIMTLASLALVAEQPLLGQPTTSSSAAPSATPPIQGGVQTVQLTLESLRDLGLDLKHLLKAVSGMWDEVNICPVQLITQPEMIGPGVIINIPIGSQPIGPPAPPKKERVDVDMSQMAPEITQLKTNVDQFLSGQKQLDLTADVQQEMQPYLNDWVANVTQLYSLYTVLQQQTQGPPYDNAAISNTTLAMQTLIKNLDKARSEMYKIVHKHGKQKRFF